MALRPSLVRAGESCTCSSRARPWPDAGCARARRNGIADEREVFIINVEDRPAALGELTRLAEANVNVDLAYTTFTSGKIVIATDDVGGARAALP
jgi:hypothetical protein